MKQLSQQIQEALLGGKKFRHAIKGPGGAKLGTPFNELSKGDPVFMYTT